MIAAGVTGNDILIVLLVMAGVLSTVNWWLRRWLKRHP